MGAAPSSVPGLQAQGGRGLPPTFSLAGFVPAGNSDIQGGFFTIVSSLPGAVWTHAIYPETGRLLASQSTTKNGTVLSGRMLVGTCTMPP